MCTIKYRKNSLLFNLVLKRVIIELLENMINAQINL
jgi:hypothetical protein